MDVSAIIIIIIIIIIITVVEEITTHISHGFLFTAYRYSSPFLIIATVIMVKF
jgi:hypothetical protein